MSQEILKTVSIKDFVQTGSLIDCCEHNMLICNNLYAIVDYGMVRLDFCLILFCERGHAQVNVNGKVFALQKDDVLVCLPFSIWQKIQMSKDLKVTLLCCSANMLNTVLKGEENTDSVMKFVQKKPIWSIPSNKKGKIIFFQLEKLILEKVNSEVGYCRQKILMYLFCALFGELMAAISTLVHNPRLESHDTKRVSIVFHSFMDEVMKDGGMHRSVTYYANLLCYSPKYISYVIKAASGRTALDWINENAMEHIKHHLKYSDKSVKEIANQFGFPNISFFGKYVKRYLGMSPMQYRNLPKERQNICKASKV